MNEHLKENYELALSKIRALDKDGKVSVLLATKMQTPEDINYLISLGATIIGENKVNELLEKYEQYDKRASLHFIGTLQRNKVKYIYDKVDMIHSVDKMSLAEEINKQCAKIGKVMDVLIEVNSGREENKSGAMPEDVATLVRDCSALPYLNVRGLMTMAPRCETKEEYMKYFSLTRALFDEIFGNDDNAVLSMGMSQSYEYAIEAGSTLVRLGSTIFGERKYL
jgi:pyridoxal phosphate enzyme (YggS family)